MPDVEQQFNDSSSQAETETQSDSLADEVYADLEKGNSTSTRADQTSDVKTMDVNGWNMHSPQRRLF